MNANQHRVQQFVDDVMAVVCLLVPVTRYEVQALDPAQTLFEVTIHIQKAPAVLGFLEIRPGEALPGFIPTLRNILRECDDETNLTLNPRTEWGLS